MEEILFMKKSRVLSAVLAFILALPVTSAAVVSAVTAVKGDVNSDNTFNLSDMITFNKYLLGRGELGNAENGDVNGDESLDIFDYVEMRKMLLSDISQWSQTMGGAGSVNLCQGVKASQKKGKEADDRFILGQTEFSLELLKNTAISGENVLLSPYSVMQALAMTANGADGASKEEMEKVLGGLKIEELNEYLLAQRLSQPSIEGCSVNIANSIWTNKDEMRSAAEFIQTNVDYYDSDVFSASFNDAALNDINNWISDKTDGMIPKMLDKFGTNAVMELINAVAFDSEWEVQYSEKDIIKSVFHAADGSEQDIEMLSSDESIFLEAENAVGFMKPYKGGRYSFAALLPENGTTPEEFVESLDAEEFNRIFEDKDSYAEVHVSIPKFNAEYGAELPDALKKMGMETAFTEKADFSKMSADGGKDIYIGNVIHKTALELTEKGTRAAAATVVEMQEKGMPMNDISIVLNRPFVYCIIDNETSLPLFIGIENSIEK